jgi:diguanylate cyclase (GGDEF)-like protein
MYISPALNSILGSGLVLILIFADYIRKYNTDVYQRRLFIRILITTLLSMIADFFFFLFEGVPGKAVYYFLHVDLSIYYVFQVAAFCYVFAFLDYLSFKDQKRTERIIHIIWSVLAVHIILLCFNPGFGLYYTLSPENFLIRGRFFWIRLFVASFPVLMVFIDLGFMAKTFVKFQTLLSFFFILLTGLGAGIDIILRSSALIWSCFVSGLLFTYFFIIRSDSKIDSLTGIGNRYSFNEFIDRLAKQNSKQSYTVVMIDMDHFKEINDTLGHLEGDNALRDMAAIIKGCIRYSDFAARYGGDEFVLAAKKEHDIERIMERIQETINIQNEKKVRPYHIQISYGYDVFAPNSGQSIEAFLQHIDTLMYKHKAEKRRSTDKAD